MKTYLWKPTAKPQKRQNKGTDTCGNPRRLGENPEETQGITDARRGNPPDTCGNPRGFQIHPLGFKNLYKSLTRVGGGPLGLLRGMGVMDIVLYVRLLPKGVSTNPHTSPKQGQTSPEQPQSQPKASTGARRKQTARASQAQNHMTLGAHFKGHIRYLEMLQNSGCRTWT